MGEWINLKMDVWINGFLKLQMVVWIDAWMNKFKDGWNEITDGWIIIISGRMWIYGG